MADDPKRPVPRFTIYTTADQQRIRAARLAMFQAMLKEALDG